MPARFVRALMSLMSILVFLLYFAMTPKNGPAQVYFTNGKPYDLAGKRIVFTNWYYVQPGALNSIRLRSSGWNLSNRRLLTQK